MIKSYLHSLVATKSRRLIALLIPFIQPIDSLLVYFYFSSNVFLCLYQVDLRRANNCEIMLTKIKIPLPDMLVSFCCQYLFCLSF